MVMKFGTSIKIIKCGSLTDVAKSPVQGVVLEEKNPDFLYFRCIMLHLDDGSLKYANGNGDVFPKDEGLKSYKTFISKHVDLDHDFQNTNNIVGKIIDAYPVENKETGECYIEGLCKIDRKANPVVARQIEVELLHSVSMEASVSSSSCSICGHTIYTDTDAKCEHFAKGLNREFTIDIDGVPTVKKCYAINRGITFTGLGIVTSPADSDAKILSIISELHNQLSKSGSCDSNKNNKIMEELKNIMTKLSSSAQQEIKEQICDVKENKDDIQNILKKMNAFEYMQVFDHIEKKISGNNKKIDDNKQVVAEQVKDETPIVEVKKEEAKTKPEGWNGSEVVEVKDDAEVKIANKNKDIVNDKQDNTEVKVNTLQAAIKPIFMKKANLGDSYWLVLKNHRPILKVVLGNAWAKNDLVKYEKYITSTAYANSLIKRIEKEGVEKVSTLINLKSDVKKEDLRMNVTKQREGKFAMYMKAKILDKKLGFVKTALNLDDKGFEKLKSFASKCPNCFSNMYLRTRRKKSNIVEPLLGKKVSELRKEESAFDIQPNIVIGEGYVAVKDKETKEIIVKDKEGKEVGRYVDAFGEDMVSIMKFFTQLLKLEKEKKPDGEQPLGPTVDEVKKEVAPSVPAQEQAPAQAPAQQPVKQADKQADPKIKARLEYFRNKILKSQSKEASRDSIREKILNDEDLYNGYQAWLKEKGIDSKTDADTEEWLNEYINEVYFNKKASDKMSEDKIEDKVEDKEEDKKEDKKEDKEESKDKKEKVENKDEVNVPKEVKQVEKDVKGIEKDIKDVKKEIKEIKQEVGIPEVKEKGKEEKENKEKIEVEIEPLTDKKIDDVNLDIIPEDGKANEFNFELEAKLKLEREKFNKEKLELEAKLKEKEDKLKEKEAKLKEEEEKQVKEKVVMAEEKRKEKTLKALSSKKEKIESIINEMTAKNMIVLSEEKVEAFLKEGKLMLDARNMASKIAIDQQRADLYKMDDNTLEAFGSSVKRIKKMSGKNVPDEKKNWFNNTGNISTDASMNWIQKLPWK